MFSLHASISLTWNRSMLTDAQEMGGRRDWGSVNWWETAHHYLFPMSRVIVTQEIQVLLFGILKWFYWIFWVQMQTPWVKWLSIDGNSISVCLLESNYFRSFSCISSMESWPPAKPVCMCDAPFYELLFNWISLWIPNQFWQYLTVIATFMSTWHKPE